MSTEERVRRPRSFLTQVDLWIVWTLSIVVGVSQLLVTPASVSVGDLPGWPLVVMFYLFFLPGYALVSALFPWTRSKTATTASERAVAREWQTSRSSWLPRVGDYSGIDTLERVGLSLAGSVVLSTLVGVVLHFSPWGITRFSVVLGISSLTVVLMGLAVLRRQSLPARERYVLPVTAAVESVRRGFDRGTGFDRLVTVVVVLSLVVAAGSIAYGVTGERVGETPTELYLLGASPTATPAAEGYPTTFVLGQPQTVILGITSHERSVTDFVVVTQLERMQQSGDSTVVERREELSRTEVQLAPGETHQSRQAVTPTFTGISMRLTYLLYVGQPPENPTTENAYRSVHIWIDVYLPGEEPAPGAAEAEVGVVPVARPTP